MQLSEREMTEAVFLCTEKGQLNPAAIGFARSPLIQSNLKKNFMKKKKWNHWTIFGEEILLSIAIWHLDHTAIFTLHMFYFETERSMEKQVFFPRNRIKLPDVFTEEISFANQELRFKMHFNQYETCLEIEMEDVENEKLQAEIFIFHPPEDESLHVVIPKNRSIFQYTAKEHTLPTTGYVQHGEKKYLFHADYCFTVFNVNRGLWPKRTEWTLGLASQRIGQERIGLNLASQWTTGSGITENAVFIDGKMHKMPEELVFSYEEKEKGKPWTIRSKFSPQIQLTFSPFFHKQSTMQRQFLQSSLQQHLGYFNGTILLANGRQLTIRQMLGLTEHHQAKW